jgi:hypothetical protein
MERMDGNESVVFAWLSAFMDGALKFYMWRNWWVGWKLTRKKARQSAD